MIGRARSRWIALALKLSDELWQEVLDTYLTTVISWTGRMIQLRYLHQMYYTPVNYSVCIKETLQLVTNAWGLKGLFFTWSGNV